MTLRGLAAFAGGRLLEAFVASFVDLLDVVLGIGFPRLKADGRSKTLAPSLRTRRAP